MMHGEPSFFPNERFPLARLNVFLYFDIPINRGSDNYREQSGCRTVRYFAVLDYAVTVDVEGGRIDDPLSRLQYGSIGFIIYKLYRGKDFVDFFLVFFVPVFSAIDDHTVLRIFQDNMTP